MIDTCLECPFYTPNDGDFTVYLGCGANTKVLGTCNATGAWIVDPEFTGFGCLVKPGAEYPAPDLDIE